MSALVVAIEVKTNAELIPDRVSEFRRVAILTRNSNEFNLERAGSGFSRQTAVFVEESCMRALVLNGTTVTFQADYPDPRAQPGSSLCLLYTSPSPRDLSTSRMPSSA